MVYTAQWILFNAAISIILFPEVVSATLDWWQKKSNWRVLSAQWLQGEEYFTIFKIV